MGKSAGRPALPKAKKRSERILTYVTPPEYRAIKARRKRGQTISQFARDTLLAACQDAPKAPPTPEVTSTSQTPALESIVPDRVIAPQASPPVTAEKVKRRLKEAGINRHSANFAADRDPQAVAEILDHAQAISPAEIFNRIMQRVA